MRLDPSCYVHIHGKHDVFGVVCSGEQHEDATSCVRGRRRRRRCLRLGGKWGRMQKPSCVTSGRANAYKATHKCVTNARTQDQGTAIQLCASPRLASQSAPRRAPLPQPHHSPRPICRQSILAPPTCDPQQPLARPQAPQVAIARGFGAVSLAMAFSAQVRRPREALQ